MKKCRIVFVGAAFAALLLLSGCPPSVDGQYAIHVVPPGQGTLGDGSSWNSPLWSIQDAINTAAYLESQDPNTEIEVWVKKGTYYENIVLYTGSKVFGNFDGDETTYSEWSSPSFDTENPAPLPTVINGNGADHTVMVWDTATSSSSINDVVLSSFEITGGWADGEGLNGRGAGIFVLGDNADIYQSIITIGGCRIVDNHADTGAAGIQVYGCKVSLAGCWISDNGSLGEEYNSLGCAGISVGRALNNTLRSQFSMSYTYVVDNYADVTEGNGGVGGASISGFSSASVNHCYFWGNQSCPAGRMLPGGGTGGLAILALPEDGYPSVATVSNTEFDGNINYASGIFWTGSGAMSVSGNVTIEKCTFENNVSTAGAGAVQFLNYTSDEPATYNPLFKRCLFKENHAGTGGGAAFSMAGGRFENCMFANNDVGYLEDEPATVVGGGAMVIMGGQQIVNCSFSGNTVTGLKQVSPPVSAPGGAILVVGGNVSVLNSIIWNNTNDDGINEYYITPGFSNVVFSNNYTSNPLFVDAANSDLHIQSNSPCKNMLDISATAPAKDYDNQSRPMGTYDDIGADEAG